VFRFWSTKYVRHLEAEIEYLRAQMEHERQRAEIAIDTLLSVRVQVQGVTQPTPREAQQAETLVDKLLKDAEFAQVGE
jgi:hypothetical protein